MVGSTNRIAWLTVAERSPSIYSDLSNNFLENSLEFGVDLVMYRLSFHFLIRVLLMFDLFFMNAIEINVIRIPKRIADEPIVPKFNPPFSIGLVRKSPKVAPNGRVNTNANQNKMMRDIFVK